MPFGSIIQTVYWQGKKNSMAKHRILITGASGIIGRQTLKYLENPDAEIHVVSRQRDPSFPRNVSIHTGDILAPTFTSNLVKRIKPTHLLHLAWTTKHGAFWEDPENQDWYRASCHLASEFVTYGGRRLVIAGTCAEYDWTSETIRQSECTEFETPLAASNLYGQTKNKLREYLADNLDISFGWGRVFFPYGPYENHSRLIPHVITSLLQEHSVKIGPGTDIRDFMSTYDAGMAFAKFLMSETQGAVNIATGEGHSIAEIAQKIACKLNKSDLLEIGALPPRPMDPPYLVGDNTRLVKEVGMSEFMSIDSGLEKSINWWKSRL